MKSEQYFKKPVEINKYSSKEPVEIKISIEGFDCKVPVQGRGGGFWRPEKFVY
jgi:hypothetical protein